MLKPKKGLVGKAVVSKEGSPLGEISDSIINDKTGKIDYIKVKPLENLRVTENYITRDHDYTIPASCFITVKDIVVVEEDPKKRLEKEQ